MALRALAGAAWMATLATVLGACGEPTPVITITRVELPGTACDPPADALQLYATALGDFVPVARSGGADRVLELDGVPADTRELAISVLGLGADDVIGRTGTLAPGRLTDGGELALVIAPPGISCAGPPLATALGRPLVARAGDGVLIVGAGADEWFERATARLHPVTGRTVSPEGAALAPLADGRALVVGQGSWQVFDPSTLAFSPAQDAVRLHAGAQVGALANGTVLIAGGCREGVPPCEAVSDALVFDPATDTLEPAFGLARARAGGHAAAVGERVWLVGGTGQDGASLTDVELWAPEGSLTFDLAADAIAAVPSGAAVVLTATGPAWLAPSGRSTPIDGIGPLPGASMLTFDDGAVLIAGGGAPGAPGAWIVRPEGATPLPSFFGAEELLFPGLALLPDGLALLVGGREGAVPRADLWLLRHALAGPWDALRPEVFAAATATGLIPSDLGQVTRTTDALRLSAEGEDAPLASWAVGGAPIFGDVELELTARATDGAGLVALVAWHGPERHVELRLSPGAVPLLARARAGALIEVCSGTTPLPADRLSAPARLRVSVVGGRFEASLDDVLLLACDEAVGGGRIGVGTIGAAGSLDVLTIEARRVAR